MKAGNVEEQVELLKQEIIAMKDKEYARLIKEFKFNHRNAGNSTPNGLVFDAMLRALFGAAYVAKKQEMRAKFSPVLRGIEIS